MKAIVYEGPDTLLVKEVPIPKPGAGKTLIKVSYAGICGSDMTIYSGKHPRAKAPLILGHEFSGYIASENPEIRTGALVTVYPYLYCGQCEVCENGRPNACPQVKLIGIDEDGGMAEYVAVPNKSIVVVPAGVSEKLAAFIEPVGIAVHCMLRGGYRPGDSVVLFGAGPIGLAIAISLRLNGATDLMLVEPNEKRAAFARCLGFRTFAPGPDILDRIWELTEGLGADCVFDCAGHQSVIDLLPDATKCGGKIILVAGYKLPPTMNFQQCMMRELSIQFVRNCSRREFKLASGLIGKSNEYEKLLNCTLPIEQAQQGFDLMAKPSDALKVLFHIG